jgi:hypothetical protein
MPCEGRRGRGKRERQGGREEERECKRHVSFGKR